MRYKSAAIEAEVKVYAYEDVEGGDKSRASGMDHGARRTVTMSFRESFADDNDLDAALEAFGAAVREAARR